MDNSKTFMLKNLLFTLNFKFYLIQSDSEMTNVVHYTWDQGLTWEKLKIANSTLDVTNIIIEPTNMAQRFLLYGQKRTKGSNDEPSRLIGIVAALDFKALH
jgi:hypothetical protein